MLKRFFQFFKDWYQQWKDYFQMRVNDRLTKKLYKALLNKSEDRLKLKKEIFDFIRTEFKVNPRSKHIPFSLRRQIVDAVYKKFRERMEPLDVHVNYSLQLGK